MLNVLSRDFKNMSRMLVNFKNKYRTLVRSTNSFGKTLSEINMMIVWFRKE